jgi:hypothetical protein
VPDNAAEADLGAQFVAASEQWKDCLRLAQEPETTPAWAMKCRTQATSMMRQANSALRLLLRMQNTRRKLEADDAARDRLAWTEHCALGLMTEALAPAPPAAEPAAAPPQQPPSPERVQADRTSGGPRFVMAGLDPAISGPRGIAGSSPAMTAHVSGQPEAALLAAAERYAAAYPERAARIRRTGKLPSDVRYFDPPEAALARALIAGQTPALTALDREYAQARAA